MRGADGGDAPAITQSGHRKPRMKRCTAPAVAVAGSSKRVVGRLCNVGGQKRWGKPGGGGSSQQGGGEAGPHRRWSQTC